MKWIVKPAFKKTIKMLIPFIIGLAVLTGIIKFVMWVNACDDRARAASLQNAYIRVQYDASGRAMNCWVTHNDGVAVGGSTAVINMQNWHDYDWFAKKLGADPNKCDVWNWEGKK